MAYGKNIRIYLADGSVGGIRHAEVVNWTGQAVACARSRLGELKDWPEAERPGVYFLFGLEDGATVQRAYIGEAEVVITRLLTHVREKEFWNEVVLFTSKDEHLTKAHVKYLESRLIGLAEEAGRYELQNGKSSGVSRLPRGDMDAMEEFIGHLRVLLGALGHRLLEPISSIASKPSAVVTSEGTVLRFSARDARASMQVVDDGFVVRQGSTAVAEHTPAIANYLHLKERLIAEGNLVRKGEVYEFARDTLFSSSSAAAAVIAGSVRNGRDVWKDDSGRSLKEIEEASLAALEAAAPRQKPAGAHQKS